MPYHEVCHFPSLPFILSFPSPFILSFSRSFFQRIELIIHSSTSNYFSYLSMSLSPTISHTFLFSCLFFVHILLFFRVLSFPLYLPSDDQLYLPTSLFQTLPFPFLFPFPRHSLVSFSLLYISSRVSGLSLQGVSFPNVHSLTQHCNPNHISTHIHPSTFLSSYFETQQH